MLKKIYWWLSVYLYRFLGFRYKLLRKIRGDKLVDVTIVTTFYSHPKLYPHPNIFMDEFLDRMAACNIITHGDITNNSLRCAFEHDGKITQTTIIQTVRGVLNDMGVSIGKFDCYTELEEYYDEYEEVV